MGFMGFEIFAMIFGLLVIVFCMVGSEWLGRSVLFRLGRLAWEFCLLPCRLFDRCFSKEVSSPEKETADASEMPDAAPDD